MGEFCINAAQNKRILQSVPFSNHLVGRGVAHRQRCRLSSGELFADGAFGIAIGRLLFPQFLKLPAAPNFKRLFHICSRKSPCCEGFCDYHAAVWRVCEPARMHFDGDFVPANSLPLFQANGSDLHQRLHILLM